MARDNDTVGVHLWFLSLNYVRQRHERIPDRTNSKMGAPAGLSLRRFLAL
jgi:hypothetical protein